MMDTIAKLFTDVLTKGETPTKWRQVLVKVLFKKGENRHTRQLQTGVHCTHFVQDLHEDHTELDRDNTQHGVDARPSRIQSGNVNRGTFDDNNVDGRRKVGGQGEFMGGRRRFQKSLRCAGQAKDTEEFDHAGSAPLICTSAEKCL